MLKEPWETEKAKVLLSLSLLACLILAQSASSSKYDYGTKVFLADEDIGRPLYEFQNETFIGYWDIGTSGYDVNDPVYLHIAPSNRIMANDLRLTHFESFSAGSKVTPPDPEIGMILSPLNATINYLDLHGSRAYDLEDPTYIHQCYCSYADRRVPQKWIIDGETCKDQSGAIDIEGDFEVRLPLEEMEAIHSPHANLIVYSDDYKLWILDQFNDKIPEMAGKRRFGKVIEVIHGIKADYYHILDSWFVKIVPRNRYAKNFSDNVAYCGDNEAISSTQFICTNDIRLNKIAEQIAGTKVSGFDIDQNKLIAAPVLMSFPGKATDLARICYFDVNGNGVYDYPDEVYLNLRRGVMGGIVSVNDVRLSESVG